MKILKINALEKTYDNTVQVLNDINLDMEAGGFLILVGPSGCGKSTLLNCIAGLETTTSGSIEIAGRDVTQVEPKDRDISMVFQSYALYPTMTVRENIAFGMRVRGVPKEEQRNKIQEVASQLQIDHLLDRKPGQLSGGQRQRVAIGRALVRHPSLYLFDEPLSNLDAKLRVEMRAELKALHEKTRASFVYVTHDQVEAMTMGTQIAVLNGGSIQQYGTPDEIYHNPSNVFVASFMGSPPMNILKGKIERNGQALSVCFLSDDGIPHRVNVPHYDGTPLQHGTEVLLGIRPEYCYLDNSGETIELRAMQVEVTGVDQFVKFRCGDDRVLTARFSDASPMHAGANVRFSLKTSEIRLFDPGTEKAIDSVAEKLVERI
ncbi:ABC transporter ATP-binding protein [Marinobacterium sp. OS208]|nr:ABC transporter ATP-binding protein [Marinobacterium sedimentorum]